MDWKLLENDSENENLPSVTEYLRRRQTSTIHWRWEMKAWVAKQIRYLRSPSSKRSVLWIFILSYFLFQNNFFHRLTLKYCAWRLQTQVSKLKVKTRTASNSEAWYLIRCSTNNLTSSYVYFGKRICIIIAWDIVENDLACFFFFRYTSFCFGLFWILSFGMHLI